MPTRLRLAVAACACAAALSACGSGGTAQSSVSPTSAGTTSYAVPSGTVSLASLGWRNGPAGRVFLPVGTTIDRRIDQANVVSAFGPGGASAQVLAALRRTLPAAGWTVTADAGGSLIFADGTYDGAFTSDADVWGLTIRVRR